MHKKDQILVEPSLDASWYHGEKELEKILRDKQPAEVVILRMQSKLDRHSKIVSAGVSRSSASTELWAELGAVELRNLEKVYQEFRTPSKLDVKETIIDLKPVKIEIWEEAEELAKEVGRIDTEVLDTIEVKVAERGSRIAADTAALDQMMRSSYGVVLSDWNKLVTAVSLVKLHVEQSDQLTGNMRGVMISMLQQIEAKIQESDHRAQIITSMVDSDRTASDAGALSVWKALRAL